MTQRLPLSYAVKCRRLCLFGNIAQINELAYASQILFAQSSDKWRRTPGGHALRAFEMFATTCPHLALSC